MRKLCKLLCLMLAVLPAMAQRAAHPSPDDVVDTSAPTCYPLFVEHDALFRQGDEPHYSLAAQINWSKSGFASADPVLNSNTSYVILVTEWQTGGKQYTLKSSSWYVYQSDGNMLKQNYAAASTKVLLPYGSKNVVFAGIQILNPSDFPDYEEVPESFTDTEIASTLTEYRAAALEQLKEWLNDSPSTITNSVSVAKGTPENTANLAALLGAVAGISGGAKTGITAAGFVPVKTKRIPIPIPVCFESQEVRTVKALPFDLTLGFTLTSGTVQAVAAAAAKDSSGPVNCSQLTNKSCSIARTFGASDKEWWDVNIGIALPGIVEPKFSFNDKAGTVATSVTRHTDVYGFISLYPGAFKWRKSSWCPHVDVGIPFAGQPLHRPFFGAAEKIPLTEKLLKIPGFFYAGTSRLIETVPGSLTVGSATTASAFAADLRHHIVWKGMYGVEFPVGSLLSKIGKK